MKGWPAAAEPRRLDICQGAEVAFAADEDSLRTMVTARKKELAFSLGGMGSASTNYYNQAYSRHGWADVAPRSGRCKPVTVTAQPLGDRRDGAGDYLDPHRIHGATRLCVWRDARVGTVRLYPAGDTLAAALHIARAIGIVHEISE